jgi:Tol biopolymer transport system component
MTHPILRLAICALLVGIPPVARSNAQPGPGSLGPALVMKGEISALHVSRDGRYVVFIDWNGGELSVHDRTTNMDRQLTHKGPSDAGQYPGTAAISPDNQMVAYNWYKPDGFELRLMPLSGGEPRHIDTGGVAGRLQGWTPDGRELLILKAKSLEETGDLGFVNIETGRFRRITQAQASTHARLSPDGSQIVLSELSKQDPTQNDIHLVDCATGKKQLLLGGLADDYSPDWAPGGKNVVLISDRGGRPRLWHLRLPPARQAAEPLNDLVDGDLTIIGAAQDQVLVGAEDIGGTDSYSGTVDWVKGRVEDVRLLRNPPYKGSRRPVPSPDGKQVAFLRRSRGYRVRPGWQVPVVYSFGAERERVYPTALTLRDAPVWYPDASALLFAMPPEGAVGDSIGREWRFVHLDLKSGRYAEVGRTATSGLVRMAGLTGRSLFYLLGGNRIMALDWRTGANRELFRWSGSDASITDAAVLGDGERIALAVWGKPATILQITPPSTEPVRVTEVQTNSRPQLVWCSDRRSILMSGTLAGKQGIWRIPTDGGEPRLLQLEQSDITEVRLSENGERIAFTRRIPQPREVWAYPHPRQ